MKNTRLTCLALGIVFFMLLEAHAHAEMIYQYQTRKSILQGQILPCFALIGGSSHDFEARLQMRGSTAAKRIKVSAIQYTGYSLIYIHVPIAQETPPGQYFLDLQDLRTGMVLGTWSWTVLERNFPLETLRLNASLTGLRAKPDPKKKEESRILSLILEKFSSPQIFELTLGTMVFPVDRPRLSSYFGESREWVYSGGMRAQSTHTGIDYGGNHLPVHAMQAGKVVFSGSRILTGNTLVIEHAPGIMSLYYHMSALGLRVGEQVQRNQLIGFTGSTGLATGPHLHWEVRDQAVPVDPSGLVQGTLLDKDGIISILSLSLDP